MHYKARNFPKTLTDSEQHEWERWRIAHIQDQLPEFMKSLSRLSATEKDENKQFILQELQLWLESIAPTDLSSQDVDA